MLHVVDERTKHSVNRWIRELEQEMQRNHVSIISDIVILYYRVFAATLLKEGIKT